MSIFRGFKHFWEDPAYKVCKWLLHFVEPEKIPDRIYLKYQYHFVLGKILDLKHPKSFNEKLQWLKLYNRNPLYTKLVDKFEVKEWVAEKIGKQYTIPTLAVYDNINQIDLDELPKQFVLKCTHDSGSIVICKNKKEFDLEASKKVLEKGLKNDFFSKHREWPYQDVPRRIIAESYLTDCQQDIQTSASCHKKILMDYRFYCFDGEPMVIYAYTNYLQEDGSKPEPSNCEYMDLSWQPLQFHQHSLPRGDVPKPGKIMEMKSLASILSKDIPFVRVDFYCNDDRIYFGEMTFFPGSGLSRFYPDSYDLILGHYLRLPSKRNG